MQKFSEFFNFIELASQNIKNSILAHKISIQTSKNFFRRFVYAYSIKKNMCKHLHVLYTLYSVLTQFFVDFSKTLQYKILVFLFPKWILKEAFFPIKFLKSIKKYLNNEKQSSFLNLKLLNNLSNLVDQMCRNFPEGPRVQISVSRAPVFKY